MVNFVPPLLHLLVHCLLPALVVHRVHPGIAGISLFDVSSECVSDDRVADVNEGLAAQVGKDLTQEVLIELQMRSNSVLKTFCLAFML